MILVAETECRNSLEDLKQGAALLGITLTAAQEDAFVAYCALLQEVGQHTNLTAVREPSGVMRTLFLDSLTVVLALPEWALVQPVSVVDVGSGAGFPVMPLKILFPSWDVTLVESVAKKARFLELLVDHLGMTQVRIENSRAEDLARDRGRRERGDIAVARAVAPLSSLVELCAPLVRSQGTLIFPKSGQIDSELRAAEVAARRLGCRAPRIVKVPATLGLGEHRLLVSYERQGRVPPGYPRRTGLAQSRPIGS